MARAIKLNISNTIKTILRPIASRVRLAVFALLGLDKQELDRKLDAVSLIQTRMELLEKYHLQLQDGVNALTASFNMVFGGTLSGTGSALKKEDLTYFSNGFINADAYLALALANENSGLAEIKSKYGEDGWYFLFEKIFRGSEEEISRRQEIYMDYLQTCYLSLKTDHQQGYFLDFGSGRGEFLSLLDKKGIPARGVDTNGLNIEYVSTKGLDVTCIDGLSYLKAIKSDSLFGITMFQVAEHLEFGMLKEFIGLAYEKIIPGGMVLIETVNPSCIRAMQYFYVDPSHVRPYPPELLKFHAEWVGFVNVKIIFYMPVFDTCPEADQSNYIGYALIGYKPAIVEVG